MLKLHLRNFKSFLTILSAPCGHDEVARVDVAPFIPALIYLLKQINPIDHTGIASSCDVTLYLHIIFDGRQPVERDPVNSHGDNIGILFNLR